MMLPSQPRHSSMIQPSQPRRPRHKKAILWVSKQIAARMPSRNTRKRITWPRSTKNTMRPSQKRVSYCQYQAARVPSCRNCPRFTQRRDRNYPCHMQNHTKISLLLLIRWKLSMPRRRKFRRIQLLSWPRHRKEDDILWCVDVCTMYNVTIYFISVRK